MELFNTMLKERDLNLDILFNRFSGKEINNSTILELVEYHNKDIESCLGTDYAYLTFEKYDILKRKLQVFIPEVYEKKDVRLRDQTQNLWLIMIIT